MAAAMQPTQAGEGVPAQAPLPPGELAPHFPQLEILECLGRGGMGVVYKARQKSLNRLVALKLLAPERTNDPEFAARFGREAQALAALNHPNIVGVHDFGRAGGFYFLLMEFVDGVNLRQLLRSRRLAPAEALGIVPAVCNALQCAHEHGIVHRDIKPENLLMDRSGTVKIADFGVAKMVGTDAADPSPGGSAVSMEGTQEGVGTPGYSAPEQVGGVADHRADLYSLGVVLYEMLTGELPGASLVPPLRRVQVDIRLDEIVLRALERDPELRFQTAAEMRTRVETVATTVREGAPRPTPSRPRILKTGNGQCATPERLATVMGQLFHFRDRVQLVLDEGQLTISRAGEPTSISLESIRDLSIGEYPASVNPLGLDYIDLTYAVDGGERRVLFSPSDGLFGVPSQWNRRVAEWHAAIQEAARAATGRVPPMTPRERLPKVPGSRLGWLLLIGPAVGVVLAMFIALRVNTHGKLDCPGMVTAIVPMISFAAVFTGMWLVRRRGWRVAVVVVAAAGFLGAGTLYLALRSLPSASEAIHGVRAEAVGVSNTVAIVDVTTEVERWSAELRVDFIGPHLTSAEAAALAEEVKPGFTGTLVEPMFGSGYRTRRLHPAGRQTWRLGFAFPTADLAQKALANLRPFERVAETASGEPGYRASLVEVKAGDGQSYEAIFEVGPPLHSGKPNWMQVLGSSSRTPTSLHFTWQVNAARPGQIHLSQSDTEGPAQTAPLRKALKVPRVDGNFPGAEVELELVRLDASQTRVTRTLDGASASQILPVRFDALAAEVARTALTSAKPVRGEQIELCRLNGGRLLVQVVDLPAGRP